jgi:CelD/BcsL family acetyltransferase involved in cellulose biosynthesis
MQHLAPQWARCPMFRSPPDPLRFEHATDEVRVGSVRGPIDLDSDWDTLADRVGAPPFLRPGWFAAWHRAYGNGTLEVLRVRDEGRLVGVLPVELRDGATLSPTNTHTPVFGAIAASPDAERALARKLLDVAEGRIEFAYVETSSTLLATLREMLRSAKRSERRSVLTEVVARPPYVATAGGWDAYLAGRSRKLLKDIRRRRRRLEEVGTVEVTVHSSVHGLTEALDEFVALEASDWKAVEGTSIGSRGASRRFYAEIAHWAARRGWLRLIFLRLDGRPVAAEFDLECGGSLYALKCGFDSEYRSFGPGQLLNHDCIKMAFDGGLSSYEFLGTDEPYKMFWTDTTREQVRVRSFRRTVSGDLAALARHHARPLARRLRRR